MKTWEYASGHMQAVKNSATAVRSESCVLCSKTCCSSKTALKTRRRFLGLKHSKTASRESPPDQRAGWWGDGHG
jgi:hypothetical protein